MGNYWEDRSRFAFLDFVSLILIFGKWKKPTEKELPLQDFLLNWLLFLEGDKAKFIVAENYFRKI